MLLFGNRKKVNRKAGKPAVAPPPSSESEDDLGSELDTSGNDNSTLHDDSIYTSATPMIKTPKLHLSHMNLLDTVPSLPPLPASMLVNDDELVDDDFLQLPESLQTTAPTKSKLWSSSPPPKSKDSKRINKASPSSVMDVPATCESGVKYESPSKWSHMPNNVTPEDMLNIMRRSRHAQDSMLLGNHQVKGIPPSSATGRKGARQLPNTPQSSKTTVTTSITPESSVDGLVKAFQQSSIEEKSTHSKDIKSQQSSLSCKTPQKTSYAQSQLQAERSPCIKMTSLAAGTGPRTLTYRPASVTSHEDDLTSSKGGPSQGQASVEPRTSSTMADGQERTIASSVVGLQKQQDEDSVAQDQSVEVISIMTPGAVLLTSNTLKLHEHELPVVYGSQAALSYVKKRTEDDDDETFYDAKDEQNDPSERPHRLTENDILKHEATMNVNSDSGTSAFALKAPIGSSEGLKCRRKKKLVAVSAETRNRSKFSIWCFRKRRMAPESDLTEFSVAPLNMCSEISKQLVPAQKEKNRRLLWRWARQAPLQQKVGRWLDKERKRVLASCREMEQEEKIEKRRIEELKNQELERQRLREKNMQEGRISSHQRTSPSLPPITSIVLREEEVSTIGESAQFQQQHQLPGFSVAKLPLCLICREGKRTHIAVPCMHFSFCSSCVEQMKERGYEKCPACGLGKVQFAKVSLEDNKDSVSFHI